ncbi:hypothetical protein L1987_63925 [Smallanthus sonchifolius]|uniref:Uncharacterized protein n=1 Tax=Smallanthus sonchifolius TaxID=185202 RepID=A0ACB9CEN6_9ASTR|nr:hypothetical protein L1987_63925 [Smallanthus sonchifolius]
MHISEEEWMASGELRTCLRLPCMRIVSKKFSGVNVPLLSTMLNIQSTPGDSSTISADTDPTPSTSHPEQKSASTIRTPVHSIKDAQVQKLLTPVFDVIVQPEHRAPVATTYTRQRGKRTPSSLASKAQTQPLSPHSESQHSDENIKRDSHNTRETSSEASLLGSGSHPGSIEQTPEPFLSLMNLSVKEPDQGDVPSPTTTISEVLIDLASNTPNLSSSTLKVHTRSFERVDVEEAVTTAGPSNDQEDSDNITKTSTTVTHSEDASLETSLTERNPRRQETMGDGDAEARHKAPSRSKDSTTVDEDRLQLHNLELTARVATLEAEVSKLRHQVSVHEAHQCPTMPTPSLVHDLPASDDEEEETSEDWKLVVRAVDEMLTDAEDIDQTYTSFSIILEAATIISQSAAPQFSLTSTQLEFDTILAWGYDGKSERFWIGWEFGGVEELNWDFSTSSKSFTYTIYNAAKRVAYPEYSTAAERRLTPRRLEIIRSSLLTEEKVMCWRRFLYSRMVRDVEEILLLPSAFLNKVFELRSLIFNVNSLESQEMIKIIKASLYKEESGSDSDLSFLSSPTVRLNTEEESNRREEEKMKEAWNDMTRMEWEEDEIEEDEALAL